MLEGGARTVARRRPDRAPPRNQSDPHVLRGPDALGICSSSYETGERELYDLQVDPFRYRNVAGTDARARGAARDRARTALRPAAAGVPRSQIGLAATLLAIVAVLARGGGRLLVVRGRPSRRRVA